MREHIRLEALEALDAIDRYGSFAAAAAALYRVPSAVSYTINQLERELAIEVFDRSGHRAALTPAGQMLLEEGRRILLATRELGVAAQRLANRWEPELRIAIDGLVAPQDIWPTIAAFHEAQPAINLRISEEILGGTWEALIENRVDLAIGMAQPPAGSGFARSSYRDVAFCFCCAPDHPLAAIKRPLTEDDLRAWRAVVVADSSQHLSARSAGLLDGQPRLTVASMHSKIQALEQGVGVGHCPEAWAAGSIASGRLVECALATPRAPHPTWLIWRTTAPGRGLQWFINRLQTSDTQS